MEDAGAMNCPKCNIELKRSVDITENGLEITVLQCCMCGLVFIGEMDLIRFRQMLEKTQ